MPEHRNLSLREFRAMMIAMVVSPCAFAVTSVLSAWMLTLVIEALGIELDPPDRALLFLFSQNAYIATIGAYLVAGLIVFPPIVVLRARGWLSGWTAVGLSLWIPLTGAAMMAFLFGYLARVSAEEMLLIFGFLAYLVVPGTGATAIAFWMIYRRLCGEGEEEGNQLFGYAETRYT